MNAMRRFACLLIAGFVLAAALPAMAAEPKKARADIYDPSADPKEQIASALETAKEEGKHVLLQYGANWCGWCHLLHELFNENADVKKALNDNYVLVLVDTDANPNFAKETYDTKVRGVPFLSVLDASGEKLVDQETGSLEIGPKHDPAKVIAFLEKWAPKKALETESD